MDSLNSLLSDKSPKINDKIFKVKKNANISDIGIENVGKTEQMTPDDSVEINSKIKIEKKIRLTVDHIPNINIRNVIKKEAIPSIIKWTGSKRKQANEIVSYFPNYNRYFEPFLGGGAVLYLAKTSGAYANDIYSPLIEFWKLVQNDKDSLIQYYSEEWNNLQANIPEYYYNIRDRFNKNPNGLDLCFLTRTCVNGIVRFNNDGKFNNSFHLSRKGMEPETFAKIVDKWNEKIQEVKFTNLDYRELLDKTKKGDLVYLDPPYAGSNNRYTENLDIGLFMEQLEKLNKKGAKWILSFDGLRGEQNLEYPVPKDLYKRKMLLSNGNSTLNQVLNGKVKKVKESLYFNFQ